MLGYNFFQEHDKAIELIKISIKECKEKNLEKLIWNYYLYSNTQKNSKRTFKPLKENLIDLKDICKKYLKYNEKISSERQIAIIQETLYNKILDDTFLNFENDLEEIREKNNTIFHLNNPIEKPITTTKEIINYFIFNGIFLKNYKSIKLFKKYFEIIFTAEKNKLKIKVENDSKNLINHLEYFDIFIFLNVFTTNKLRAFFYEYKIEDLKLSMEDKKILLIVLDNILKLNKSEYFAKETVLTNLLIILEKIELEKEEIFKFVEIIFKKRKDILYENNIHYRFIPNLINKILYKHIDFITLENFKNILEELFKTQRDNKISKEIFSFICSQGHKKGIRNLEKTNELKFFLEKASNIERISLFKLLDNELQTNEKNIILKNLNENFDTVEYVKLIEEQIVQPDYKYEDKVLEALNGIACQKYGFSTTLEVLIDNILALFLNNFVTDEFKQKLKELNNENFKYYIEARDYKSILEYALNKENFDLNNFQEKDLRFFTKIGIKELLKRRKKYQDFMKMISNYSKENNDYISEAYIEFLEEQLTTKGDQ